MTFKEMKLRTAKGMAVDYWNNYVMSTEPDKKRKYSLQYEFWKGVADSLEEHGPHSDNAAKGCGCPNCN